MLAATGAFLVARYFLGDRFHEKLPQSFRSLNLKISKTSLRAVIAVRLTTFLHPLVHWALAASSVKLPAFLLGAFLGILPATVAIVLMGQQFLDWWSEYSTFIIGFAITATVIYVLVARRNQNGKNRWLEQSHLVLKKQFSNFISREFGKPNSAVRTSSNAMHDCFSSGYLIIID